MSLCIYFFRNWNLDLHQVQVHNQEIVFVVHLLFFCCYSLVFGCKTCPKVILAAKPELTRLWGYYSSVDSTWYEYSYVLLQRYCLSSEGDITLLYNMLLNYFSKTPKFRNSKTHLVLNILDKGLRFCKSHRIKWWNGSNLDEINTLIFGKLLNKNWTRVNGSIWWLLLKYF